MNDQKSKIPSQPKRVPSSNRGGVVGEAVEDLNRKAKECEKNKPNGKGKNEEEMKKDDAMSKMDILTSLLTQHINKYNSDAEALTKKLSGIEENTRNIERNKTEINEMSENLAKLSENNVYHEERIRTIENNNQTQTEAIKENTDIINKHRKEIEQKMEEGVKVNINDLRDMRKELETVKEGMKKELEEVKANAAKEKEDHKNYIEELKAKIENNGTYGRRENNADKHVEEAPVASLFRQINTETNEPEDINEQQKERRNYKLALLRQTNPRTAEFATKQRTMPAQTPENIMYEVATTVSFKGITAKQIRDWAWNGSEEELAAISDKDLFKHDDYKEARINVILDICQNKLFFPPSSIMITSIRPSEKHESQIIHAVTTQQFAKDLFYRAAKVQDPSFRLINFTPKAAIKRKNGLEAKMSLVRSKAPKGIIQTQLRAGVHDYIPFIKVAYPNGSGKYEARSIQEIDPDNDAPEFNSTESNSSNENKRKIEDAVRTSKTTMNVEEASESEVNQETDDEGYTEVSYNKRKSSQSPEDLRSLKKTKEEADNEMVQNLYRRMGLEMFL